MDRLDGLALWLADHEQLAVQELHIGFCGELVARGIPLWRSGLGLELLHPEQSGERSIWRADGSPVLTQAPAGVANSDDYLNSPVRIVDDTDRPFRQRLDDSMPRLPLLEDMRREGGTDYVIYPLPFLDRTRSAYLSFATQAAEGFSEADITLLETSARLLSPYAERRALRRIAVDLLDTYVGHHAGARIFGGQVLRGAVDTIEAAILMGDLRGFTAMSARRERPYVIETLNAWFDSLAVAIDAHDGEILKFMGDGLLAIFRADPDAAEACRRAFAATIDTMMGISAGNAERLGNGGMPIEFAMGLHVGEVAYGNVGGRRRMDFTVLGPAVNYASRLQDLAKRLNQPVLVSREFAAALPQNLRDLGPYPLRGIGASERVFAFPANVTANAST